MVKIKSAAQVDQNYKDGAARAPGNYKAGVQATNDWQEKASSEAAENLWNQKIQEAATAKRRQRAIQNVSNEDWKKAAADTGSQRIGPGMIANADKRTRNWEPHRQAIENVTLPDRTADPLANVDNRVKPIVQALVDTKKSIKG